MKKSEIKKIKAMSKEELLKSAKKAKEELRSMRFDLAGGKTKNVGGIRELKKEIARMLTFAGEKATEQKAKKY